MVLLSLLVPLAGLGVVRELHVIHSQTMLMFAFVLVASLVYESMLFAGVLATGGVPHVRTALGEVVLPAALVNLLIGLPVYAVIHFARPASPRRRNAYSF
jgi:hypothetical protein